MRALAVHHSTDAAAALAACAPYLESEPAGRNVMLTLLGDRIATGIDGRYWWVTDASRDSQDAVVGFALQTPLGMLAGISRMGSDALDALVPAVVDTAADLPGVVGDARTAADFAGRFATLRKVGARPVEGQRLYRLETVVPPDGVPGLLRPAEPGEAAMAEQWGEDFDRDTGEDHDGAAISRSFLAAGPPGYPTVASSRSSGTADTPRRGRMISSISP
jgi:hypothetical protein